MYDTSIFLNKDSSQIFQNTFRCNVLIHNPSNRKIVQTFILQLYIIFTHEKKLPYMYTEGRKLWLILLICFTIPFLLYPIFVRFNTQSKANQRPKTLFKKTEKK